MRVAVPHKGQRAPLLLFLLILGLMATLAAAILCSWVSSPGAVASGPLHGISFLKGCAGPTNVGDPYSCTFRVSNTVDQASDTLTITSVVDVVHAGSGDVSSGNLLPGATFTFTGGAFCNVGQTLCTLPFGASITFTTSHYTVQPTDPNPLTDNASLTWQDTCSSGSGNCPAGDQSGSSGSWSAVQTLTPTPTPTPTSTPTPVPYGWVGGIAEPPDVAESAGGSSSLPFAGIAAGVIALGAGGWYARRRWLH